MVLDESDIRLLRVLQRDGRISNQDLAQETHSSTSACWRRMRGLEQSGVIEKFTAMLNASECGLEFHAIAQVNLNRHEPDKLAEFVAAVSRREEVVDCFATTGDADYLLRVICRNKDAYNRFLEEFLFRLAAVATVKTSLILKEVKQGAPLPL